MTRSSLLREASRLALSIALCVGVRASGALAAPFAYVPNMGTDDVSVIDIATDAVVDTIAVGNAPTSVAVDPAHSRAYVVNQDAGSVSVIDTATNTVLTTVAACDAMTLGFPRAAGMVLDPLGATAYVGCASPPEVKAIDTTTFSVSSLTIGAASHFVQGLAIDPAGIRLYAQITSDFDGGVLVFIDVATFTQDGSILMSTGFFDITTPLGLAVGTSGCRVYIPHPETGAVRILDTDSMAVTTVTLPSPSVAVAVNHAETRVYASMKNGSVAVIDRPSAMVLTTVPVGGAWGLSLSPNEAFLYVANPASDSVSIIDTATNTASGSIPVGDMPRSVGQFIAPVCDDSEVCVDPAPCGDVPLCEGPEDCDDGNRCTQDSCNPMTGCANEEAPRTGCRTAEKSLLLLKDSGDDGRDKLIWKWIKGQSTSQTDFADPTASTNYSLCVYAGSSAAFVTSATVSADPVSWQPTGDHGYKYKDSTGSQSGIQRVVLRASDADKAKIIVKGKGMNLPDPTLDLADPVTVQFVKDESPLCWEASYTGPAILDNDVDEFKGKVK